MTAVPQTAANGPTPYRRRRPERTLLYRTVQAHFETWLALARDGAVDGDPVPAYVEREFRRYLEGGILAHGFARARCGECGHDFLIAFSCKGRGVCPSCNTLAHGRNGSASRRSRVPAPAGAPVGAGGAEATALFPAPRRRLAGCGAAPVPARGGAMPAGAQYGCRSRGADRRGGVHPPLRLRAQCAPALPLRGARWRIRRHPRRGRRFPPGHRDRRPGDRYGASHGAAATAAQLRAPRSARG